MVYVPTPPSSSEPVSPRVRELSKQLEQVAEEFRRRYAMSDAEVRQALEHAAGRRGGAGARRPAIALLGGVVAALVGLGVFASRAAEPGSAAAVPWVAIAVGVVVVGFVLVRLRNR